MIRPRPAWSDLVGGDLFPDDPDETTTELDRPLHSGPMRGVEFLHLQQLQLGEQSGERIVQRVL